MSNKSQKNFFSIANGLVIVGSLGLTTSLYAGAFEPLTRGLTLLFGGVGYFVPMLITLAFIIMLSFSKPVWRAFVIAVFLVIAVAASTIAGAWNVYLQATSIPTSWMPSYFTYSYTLNEKEVVNAGGYIGSGTLSRMIEESVALRPTWSTEEHLLAIMFILAVAIAMAISTLTYFVYSPNQSHGNRRRGGGNKGNVIHHYY
jgi:hypothetical protein